MTWPGFEEYYQARQPPYYWQPTYPQFTFPPQPTDLQLAHQLIMAALRGRNLYVFDESKTVAEWSWGVVKELRRLESQPPPEEPAQST